MAKLSCTVPDRTVHSTGSARSTSATHKPFQNPTNEEDNMTEISFHQTYTSSSSFLLLVTYNRSKTMSLIFRASSPFITTHRFLSSSRSLRSFPRFLKLQSRFPPRKRLSTVSASASASSPPPTKSLASDLKTSTSADTSLEWVSRTAYCGNLTEGDVGRRVRICGWVALHRIHGGVTFVSLRDHTGIVQGLVRSRPSESVNKKMKTGTIEVAAEYVLVLNSVRSALPFLVTTADDAKETVTEEIRLRYRCLDLRRQQMQSNLMLRHRVVKLIRRYLEDAHGFVEIETPMLSRSTPEGARDYLVPSRVQPGTFYALPQSPQLFKQMLMVFSDEDLRADRQPEFTQLDMELAFTPLEDMLKLNEDLIRHVCPCSFTQTLFF
ncbi:aspartate--tRNA ligase, chloroplastic/mitochondrial [Cinnamomum micranthum f. kanehirae]|uniref:Aspartate--tRNA ligase, chloroplastic/mitochondrial n=1 Tax=Cinnamomum micranthum f. kanehirae TaxID=337451 RepID=A0A3S3LYW4_9MAGN|nr:aspartate--tRNA ligase, chloroplastic/mitochondrial [Cinnamomum micranthum f. kanehirae]